MTDGEPDPSVEAELARLRARASALEADLQQARADSDEKLLRYELKAEALRHGMVDLDGLKLLDMTGIAVDGEGNVSGASAALDRMKRSKPWLFAAGNSSSVAAPPPSAPPRAKLATEMTTDEWRAARAVLLRRGR